MRRSWTRLSRVAVGMSGGVDSSVAALLLKSQGHDVIGVYMRNWDQLGDQSCTDACSVDEDLEDMRKVCRTLDIPAHTVDLSRDYWVDVFAPLVDAYSTGRLTPNPDVDCNRYIKFDKFLRLCLSRWGVDYVATGHYARLVDKTGDNGDTYRALLRGTDELKDQSYFLSMTQSGQLSQVLFPLGGMLKAQVRQIAAAHFPGQRVLSKAESSGICFVGRRRYFAKFLNQYLAFSGGVFVDQDSGRALGAHHGKEAYTVGQKARIQGAPDKYYVVGRGAQGDGNVYVVRGKAHPALFSDYLLTPLSSFVFSAGSAPQNLVRLCTTEAEAAPVSRLLFKSRYNNQLAPCSVLLACGRCSAALSEGRQCAQSACKCCSKDEDTQLVVVFERPDRAVTPGQIVALYDGEQCLGGGPIERGGTLAADNAALVRLLPQFSSSIASTSRVEEKEEFY